MVNFGDVTSSFRTNYSSSAELKDLRNDLDCRYFTDHFGFARLENWRVKDNPGKEPRERVFQLLQSIRYLQQSLLTSNQETLHHKKRIDVAGQLVPPQSYLLENRRKGEKFVKGRSSIQSSLKYSINCLYPPRKCKIEAAQNTILIFNDLE